MNNDGTLLICPTCAEKETEQFGYYRSFGSITSQGNVIIMRKGKKKTFMNAKEFILACDCGYSIYYKEGTISVGNNATSYPYDRNSTYHRN